MSRRGRALEGDEAMEQGDVVEIGFDSWAGRTWHRAKLLKVCPRRVKVEWLDTETPYGHKRVCHVPKESMRELAAVIR